MGSSMEETVANLGNWSLPLYFIFWASLCKWLFILVALSVLPHFFCVSQLLPSSYIL